MERSSLQNVLLDLISNTRPPDNKTLTTLNPKDWDLLLMMATQHRITSLLYWQQSHQHKQLSIPDNIAQQIAQQFRQHSLRSLLMQKELRQANLYLKQAGIPCLALKGAYLAYQAYPHPALRPMRDLDLLVPSNLALRAFETLLQHGYRMRNSALKDIESSLDDHQHLPGLMSPSANVNIEIHNRIVKLEQTKLSQAELDKFAAELWQRSIVFSSAGADCSYLSPTDLLLHLVIHSAYQHRLNNGPLVFSDLANLIKSHPIDWTQYWTLAEAGGWVRGSQLLFAIAEYYYGPLAIAYPALTAIHPLPQDVVETATHLSLSDFQLKRYISFESSVRAAKTVRAKAGILLRKAFPPMREMATHYKLNEDGLNVLPYYFVHWGKHLSSNLPQYFSSHKTVIGGDAALDAHLYNWLQDDHPFNTNTPKRMD